MPEPIVDALEAVEVEEEDPHEGVLTLVLSQGVGKPIEEEHAIRQTGEHIVQGVMSELLLRTAPLDREANGPAQLSAVHLTLHQIVLGSGLNCLDSPPGI